MKIIDLLNKIANGEIDRNNKYQFSKDDYCTINDFFARYIVDEENLNLEIIEEKKIPEKLDVELLGQCDNWLRYGTTEETIKDYELNPYIIDTIRKNTLEFQRKINSIIDYLKSKGE